MSFYKQTSAIISIAWQRNFTYRFTVLSYRIGEIAEVLVLILMWSAIYANSGSAIKGFTLNEMISYVLVGNLISVAVRNFLVASVSKDISMGRLSMFLVKPIPYLKYVFINEIGRSFLSTVISIATQGIVIAFFLNKIYINLEPAYLLIILMMIILAFIIEFQMNFLIGTIAFWTDEVDGIQSTIDRIKRFFSGGYFPLSLLPVALTSAGLLLPFAYTFFVPAALYLKKMDLKQGVHGLFIQVAWILILSVIIHIVWKKGLKRFEAAGL
jgi:ABC-2 type transport system permease protein